ncbi:DUF58 domain-containing protein [Kurthia sibirica]|uniref:DUF58 domain-containing protein n=1 Tax=Kurthia sibirica TaxID=202750 RepID=A0A2U3AJE8_9BACL|nr:DUF58 domain-containing protein [Kurthia sibirica]PWI24591.1 DUF58 domain-containing protein [Kurthia sibirica]GEK33545.1 hypothetical protein KSI01_10780 [Kurthia sibirica]
MNSKLQRVTSSFVRLLLVVLLLAVALLFAIIQGGFVLWFVFFMLAPFVLYSVFLFLTPINDMTIIRQAPTGRLQQGQDIKLKVTLQRKSFMPILFIVVQEMQPKGVFSQLEQQMMRKIVPIGFKRQVNWYYHIPNLPRGKQELVGIQVTIVDFLGWVRKTNYVTAPITLIVYPKIVPLHFDRLISHDQGQFSQAQKPQIQQSTMVSSVREYSPGDRMSWIHWKSFAKTGDLQTKEFEQQQNEDACIVLDGLNGPRFEGQVSLTASILNAVSKQQERVSFLSAGQQHVFFEGIESQQELQKALLHLAVIKPGNFHAVHKYAQDQALRSAKTIVFITSALTEEWLEVLARLVKKSNSIIVYIVRRDTQELFAEDIAIEEQAKVRGIIVHTIYEGDFSSYGKEDRK